MNLKKMVLALVMVVALLVPATLFSFDTAPGKFKEFSDPEVLCPDISTSITRITVLGTAEGFYPNGFKNGQVILKRGVGVFGMEGSGFYIGSYNGNHYFVTNAHVVQPDSVIIHTDSYSTFHTRAYKILSKQIFIGQGTGLGSAPGEVVYVNESQDVALLRVVGNWPALKDIGYRPVWTYTSGGDLIHEGDAVAVITAVRDDDGRKLWYFEVRYGKVIHNHPEIPGSAPSWYVAWFQLGDVTTDLKIYPGDSGSPVFAFVNGQPVIIGVARATINYIDPWTGEEQYAAYFTRIDDLMRFVLEK